MESSVLVEGLEAPIRVFTLHDEATGSVLRLSEQGAAIVSLQVPGRDGALDHVVVGFDDFQAYQPGGPGYLWHMGHVVGRCANRIDAAGYDIDGVHYDVEANNMPNGKPCHLHGGSMGFGKRRWAVVNVAPTSVTFEIKSPAGDAGYPGDIVLRVTYELRSVATVIELVMAYEATTTAPTLMNPTNHAYWNLSGTKRAGSVGADNHLRSIDSHTLQLPGCRVFTPVTDGLLPLGDLAPLAGTVFDFVGNPVTIGDVLEVGTAAPQDGSLCQQQLVIGGGLDHNFCLGDGRSRPSEITLAAVLSDPHGSGIAMEVWTDLPAIQVYSGNNLKVLPDAPPGFDGVFYGRRSAMCLETQFVPNAVNLPGVPQPILRPDGPFRSTTMHRFTVLQ